MKNIHVIQTDKPSKLFIGRYRKELFLCDKPTSNIFIAGQNQHIYITSDEEIKEGDWFISLYSNSIQRELKLDWTLNKDAYKKIILTTDQDLINDGVQAIDDEFLEWFVKNPSCEDVEVELFPKFSNKLYGIVIPKEEQKQHLINMMQKDEELGLYDIFNDEKRQGVKELIDKYKQDDENYLDSFGVTKTQFEVYRNFNKQETLGLKVSEETVYYQVLIVNNKGEKLAFKQNDKWTINASTEEILDQIFKTI